MNIENIFKNLNINNKETLIVGVSSGPDSMALLDMMQKYLPNKIIVAHINHNLRKESKEEEKYIINYCKKNNLIIEYIEIKNFTKKNIENEAREIRYAFYEKLLNKYNSKYLFLAHHGDDLIETVLMKIVRGSNLEGYAGIKKISTLENYSIIRPLLYLTKDDILKYNKDNNIKYYIDKSNLSDIYTRNRYRINILPQLKKEDIKVHEKFIKYSNTLTEYYNYIERTIEKKLKLIKKDNTINIELLLQEDDFLIKQIFFYILSNIYNNKANIIKEKHLIDLLNICKSNKPNQVINLPNNYIAVKSYNKLVIEKQKIENLNYKIEFKNDYIEKNNNILIKKVNEIDTNGNDVCRLNSNNIKLPIYIRNKKNGDYIILYKSNNKKKIKEIFIENKIPVNKRNTYPIVTDSEDNILWIPNLKKSKYNVNIDEFYDIILTSHKEREENNE